MMGSVATARVGSISSTTTARGMGHADRRRWKSIPDILSIHRGLRSSEEDTVVRSPESPTGTRNLHEERRPRSFIASDMAR